MTKLGIALLLVACARTPAIELRGQPPALEGTHRSKWYTLLEVARHAAARERVACASGCDAAPITDKQAAAIVDWYCDRDAPVSAPQLWTTKDEHPIDRYEFWADATNRAYELGPGSVVSASHDRDTFQDELVGPDTITSKVTLEISHHDPNLIPFWVHFYFDARDGLVAVNLGSGAACPFVATSFDGGAFVEHGEILTELRRPALEATQSIAAAGPDHCARAIVRVIERKFETTYLDSLELDLAGVRVVPASCPGPAYCADDGIYQHIDHGQSLDVVFDLPHGSDCRSARIVANGYYVPY